MGTLFYEPISPTVMLLSASAFLLGRFTFKNAPTKIKRFRDYVGSYNYGIYLGHALGLYLLDRDYDNFSIHISYKLWSPFISIPVTASICFILTFGLVWLLSKLPFGRWISG